MHSQPWHIDTLKRLKRKDKWYLGGGNKLTWSPAFPAYLDRPGLWDNASFYDLRIDPVWTFHLFHQGQPFLFRQTSREWMPHCLTCRWISDWVEMVEEKVMLPNDFLGERITFVNRTEKPITLQIVLWTVQKNEGEPNKESTTFMDQAPSTLLFQKELVKGKRKPITVFGALGLDHARSFQVDFSEYTGLTPDWQLTPFYETLTAEGLPNSIHTHGIHPRGLLYFGLEREIHIPAQSSQSVQCGFACDTFLETSQEAIQSVSKDIVNLSRSNWESYFHSVPQFECSDPFLNGYYPYRWFGLRLFTIDAKEGTMQYPAITEGLEYFRVFITYSAQCHILEERWNKDPSIAKGSILNFLNNQREDGSFAGHIYVNGVQENGFYHADWGRVLQSLYQIHPEPTFLSEVYPGLCRYAHYFDRERDRECTGLYDVVDQFETGQEYMSRYLAVDDQADRYGWINSIRLKGIDATVYMYNLKRALAWMASVLGKKEDQKDWDKEAEITRQAVLKFMWDPKQEFFFDLNPKDLSRTFVKSAVNFYPYLTDIVDRDHLPGLKRHLFDPQLFWSDFPVTTSSMDDPFYDEFSHWKGKRHNCPWNGRVWPMTNSHIVDLLGICARRFDDALLRDKTVELINSFVRMMHFDQDPSRPNCFEHYNPKNGKASTYRGVDDYQHSWVNDLILKYLVGIDFEENRLVIDPFPFNFAFKASGIMIKNKELQVSWDQSTFSVTYDHRTIVESDRIEKTIPD